MTDINKRDMVAVALGETNIVQIPLADAIVEYFRLEAIGDAGPLTEGETRIFAALTLTLGTLNHGDGAQKLRDALKTEQR
jgi:hypothetical protein